jgi:Ca-activated chloride channel family protein
LNLDSLPPSHLVFLIDVSASMDMPNRLPLLQSAFRLLINNLRPKDSVSIVVYGGITAVMVNSLSGEHKDSLYKVIDGLTPGGSTPGESGIKLAYQIASRHFIKGGNNRVILATDGDFNVGLKSEADLDEMISSQRQSGVYLTCLGVGMGNYKDSKIQLLAEKGNGNFAYLDNFQEAEKVLMTEFTQTLFSVADDVYMDIKFNPALISSFRLLGFDNKAGALQDSLSVIEGGEIGSGYSLEAVFEVEPTIFGSAILAHTNSTICSDTLADIKLQYRYPGDSTHLHFLHNALFTAESDSISIRKSNFTAAVIYLGMMLKQSVYVNSKKFGWDELLQLASANANMTDPYQREFVSMVQRAKELFGHKKKKGLKGLFN